MSGGWVLSPHPLLCFNTIRRYARQTKWFNFKYYLLTHKGFLIQARLAGPVSEISPPPPSPLNPLYKFDLFR